MRQTIFFWRSIITCPRTGCPLGMAGLDKVKPGGETEGRRPTGRQKGRTAPAILILECMRLLQSIRPLLPSWPSSAEVNAERLLVSGG